MQTYIQIYTSLMIGALKVVQPLADVVMIILDT